MIARVLLGLLAITLCLGVQAQESVFEEREFSSQIDESRYRTLIAELRCLVCQNQAISDSNADLAAQLRDEVYSRIIAGETDDEILDFMTARYGDYVLFDPPVKQSTLTLWIGPFIILIIALAFLLRQIKRHSNLPEDEDELPPA